MAGRIGRVTGRQTPADRIREIELTLTPLVRTSRATARVSSEGASIAVERARALIVEAKALLKTARELERGR